MAQGRVLLADDECTFALATAELLRGCGYEVLTADHANAAAALIDEFDPHVLIADINMPGNDDLRFVEQVAKARPDQQIILATGYPTVKTAADAVRLSVVAYLVKPFDLSELYEHVAHGVEQAMVLGALQTSRQRLAAWTRDLDATTRSVKSSAARARNAENAFLMLSMGNVMAVLGDMKQVVDAQAAGRGDSVAREKLGCPPPITAVNAIRDTVATLVRTKDAFRSRELGDLRKRLEAVLDGREPEGGRATPIA